MNANQPKHTARAVARVLAAQEQAREAGAEVPDTLDAAMQVIEQLLRELEKRDE